MPKKIKKLIDKQFKLAQNAPYRAMQSRKPTTTRGYVMYQIINEYCHARGIRPVARGNSIYHTLCGMHEICGFESRNELDEAVEFIRRTRDVASIRGDSELMSFFDQNPVVVGINPRRCHDALALYGKCKKWADRA